MHGGVTDPLGEFAWEAAKHASDSPRAVGALLESHLRVGDDLREREFALQVSLNDARKAGDAKRMCAAAHRLGSHLEMEGELDRAADTLELAIEASRDGTVAERTAVINDHGVLLARLGLHSEAERAYDESARLAATESRSDLMQAIRHNQATLAAARGESSSALELWNEAFSVARQRDDTQANARVLNNVAILKLFAGERDEALQLFNRAILLAQRGGDIRVLALTYSNLGLVFSGAPVGDHHATIPFAEMSLALLTGPVDILARLYVLNNNIWVFEEAHVEPARRFRSQFAETLKFFSSTFPNRGRDIERVIYGVQPTEVATQSAPEDDWEICTRPVMLRPCARCGVQE